MNNIVECCICGKECDIEYSTTKMVRTRRKTTLYFHENCYYNQNYGGISLSCQKRNKNNTTI